MIRNQRRLGVGLALGLFGALAACDSDSGSSDPLPQDYYDGNESAALGSATNEATCATCHGNTANAEGLPGNTLHNIAYHTGFKGSTDLTLLDGANACVTGWMGGTALTEGDNAWKLLEEYIQSISDTSVTTMNSIQPEVLADLQAYEDKYGSGGDATAGASAYAQSCARCHSGGLTVNAAGAPTRTTLALLSAGEIAQQVRTAGPPPDTGADTTDTRQGPMPFFEVSDLSEQELKDIIAFIKGT